MLASSSARRLTFRFAALRFAGCLFAMTLFAVSCVSSIVRRATILCVGLILPAVALAQQASGPAPQPELRAVMELLARVSSSEARFTEEKHLAALARPLLLSGRLSYARGGRVARTVFAPHEERLLVEGDTLTVESAGRGTQTLSLRNYPAAWAFVEGFRATLAGDLPTLQRYYRTAFRGDSVSWSLELLPREEQMARYVESITFRGSRGAITGIAIAETGGNRSLMKITPDVP